MAGDLSEIADSFRGQYRGTQPAAGRTFEHRRYGFYARNAVDPEIDAVVADEIHPAVITRRCVGNGR